MTVSSSSISLTMPEPICSAAGYLVAISTGVQIWTLWTCPSGYGYRHDRVPGTGGITFQPSMMPRHAHWRRIEVDAEHASALRSVWNQVTQRSLLDRHKGLALALRRLSYQAQRERPEDELLDIMIAAEALYLTQLGKEKDRGELRYRLALRAAIWADEKQVSMTKYEIFKLMQSSYDARSAVAHGGSPDPRDIKIKGERAQLPDLVSTTRTVVAAACRKALAATNASATAWPPDWDALIFKHPWPENATEENRLSSVEGLNPSRRLRRALMPKRVLHPGGYLCTDWNTHSRGSALLTIAVELFRHFRRRSDRGYERKANWWSDCV